MKVSERVRRGLLGGVYDRVEQLERRLDERIESLETRLHESHEDAWGRSRTRWRAARPTANLTWDAELTGDAFVSKAAKYGAFGADRRVVEIGPGYGRLLASAISRGERFASWTGVDLSAENVRFLEAKFERDAVHFLEADAETVELDAPADTVLSSLTFKHLFPSFEAALRNLVAQLRAGGVVIFDLIEGHRRYFEDDGVTYIRWYERGEIEEILSRVGLELTAFDQVQHHPNIVRLLVVARKHPGG